LILEALEPAEKARIDALIAGLDAPLPSAEEAPPVWTYEGVSPWLRARIEPGANDKRGSREFILVTDAAHAALVEATAPFRTARAASGAGHSLAGRIWGRLAGRPS
jgi:hypothetical protein